MVGLDICIYEMFYATVKCNIATLPYMYAGCTNYTFMLIVINLVETRLSVVRVNVAYNLIKIHWIQF